MAKSGAVWGIDIGQCALKALRCRAHEKDDNKIVVEAFDFIEYPKILSQPEANREELIREALETFLSRNDVKGDRVAISVPGQSGLARFIKLPPVEAKKIPDIVRYEARQQIPFALEDVVWDYQPLIGGSQDEGYALETEVGLFAMKRDQVARILKPLEDAGVEVDMIQLTPLALYNYVCFDRLNNLVNAGSYTPEKPPASTVVISFGTDTTDLVITNGFRVWQRNIPIGGNHFTKALSKELRLTFSNAEHLKRHATKSKDHDPKAVFQAMRPVFSDLVAEIQRSLGFFMSNNRHAKLGEVIALGNVMKLPGLQRYLAQNIDQPVKSVDDYSGLVGGSATAVPQFKDNILSFAVAYGLCVQGLDQAQLRTNLLPPEITTQRLVRSKKPWAVAAAAALLLGMTLNYFSHYAAWRSAATDDENAPQMAAALQQAEQIATTSSSFESANQELKTRLTAIQTIGNNLRSNVDGRLLWLELLKAIDAALPKDPRANGEREQTAKDVTMRPELHVVRIDCEWFDNLGTPWFTGVAPRYNEMKQSEAERAAARAAAPAPVVEAPPGDDAAPAESAPPVDQAAAVDSAPLADAADTPTPVEPEVPSEPEAEPPAEVIADEAPVDEVPADEAVEPLADPNADPNATGTDGAPVGPTGPGYVVQIVGYHFHNSGGDANIPISEEGERFLRNTLLTELEEGSVMLPDGDNGELVEVPLSKLGISYPVVITSYPIRTVSYDPNASTVEEASTNANLLRSEAEGLTGFGNRVAQVPGRARPGEEVPPLPDPPWKLRRYDFIVQFVWVPTPKTVRKNGKPAADPALEGTAGL
ncbi:MAG: type IV pilus assembly protein PilM [Pirellulales bacterium]